MTIRSITRLIALTACAVAAASSCSQEETAAEDAGGYLDVHAATDTDLVEVLTKADGDDAIALKIYGSDSELYWSADDISAVEWPLTIYTGSYTALATSGSEGLTARFDEPFYSATGEFSISRAKVTTLDLTLSLEAVKATVKFSEDFDNEAYFTSYAFTVSNGTDALTFSKAEDGTEGTLGSEGYFAVTGTLSYVLTLTNTSGQTYTVEDTFTDVEARQHYAFSFSIGTKPEEGLGLGAIEIIMDSSLNDVTHTYTFVLTDDPQILETSTYDPSEELSIIVGDTDSRKVDISMNGNAASLIISHSDEGLTAAGVPASTELVGADDETIAALTAAGITASSLSTESTSASIDFTTLFSSLPAGTYTFEIYAANDEEGSKTITAIVNVSPATAAVSANPWAMFATLSGSYATETAPEGLGFEYRATGSEEWTAVTSEITTDEATATFTAELRGLDPETEYEFRTVSARGTGTTTVAFTTESAGTVTNMNFDSWVSIDSKYWSPNESSDNIIWDTANQGTTIVSVYPTSREEDHLAVEGDGKYAAKLESKTAVGIFAAGNIYTGQFGSIQGLSGASLYWGVPFTSRPLALKGYYDYQPVAIDKTKSPYTDLEGEMDTGQIRIMLTTWSSQFTVNTNTSTFVDTDDEAIIAYAEMDLSTTEDYTEFTLELDWRRTDVAPRYIVIVGAASKLGDYFTGGVGSILYLDEFSFVYDPDELDSQTGSESDGSSGETTGE